MIPLSFSLFHFLSLTIFSFSFSPFSFSPWSLYLSPFFSFTLSDSQILFLTLSLFFSVFLFPSSFSLFHLSRSLFSPFYFNCSQYLSSLPLEMVFLSNHVLDYAWEEWKSKLLKIIFSLFWPNDDETKLELGQKVCNFFSFAQLSFCPLDVERISSKNENNISKMNKSIIRELWGITRYVWVL